MFSSIRRFMNRNIYTGSVRSLPPVRKVYPLFFQFPSYYIYDATLLYIVGESNRIVFGLQIEGTGAFYEEHVMGSSTGNPRPRESHSPQFCLDATQLDLPRVCESGSSDIVFVCDASSMS